jgi:hypothetical protein
VSQGIFPALVYEPNWQYEVSVKTITHCGYFLLPRKFVSSLPNRSFRSLEAPRAFLVHVSPQRIDSWRALMLQLFSISEDANVELSDGTKRTKKTKKKE